VPVDLQNILKGKWAIVVPITGNNTAPCSVIYISINKKLKVHMLHKYTSIKKSSKRLQQFFRPYATVTDNSCNCVITKKQGSQTETVCWKNLSL
jgi:hypothetical protein